MKNKIFLFLLPMLAAAWLPACYKAPPDPGPAPPHIPYWDTLPAMTQTGANTFGCLVNGEVWVPRVQILVPWYDLEAHLYESKPSGTGGISCRVLTTEQDDFLSMIFGPTNFDTVTCYGNEVVLPKCGIYLSINHDTYSISSKDSLDNWVKVFAIDTVKNIVAGTFQFTMFNDNNHNDKLLISDGRFDMKYQAW